MEGGRGSGLQRNIFCINYMTFTCPVYLGSQDQTLQRRVRVHDMFDSICNGRRKLFCIECYTHKYVRIRTSCQVQPLQQRDAHKFLTVADVVLYAPYTGPSSCVSGRSVQHCTLISMQNTFRLRLGICVHLFVLNVPPATQVLLSIPPDVYNPGS